VLYIMTLAAAFFFAFRELKLKEELTDELIERQHENVSDFDSFYEIRKDIKRFLIERNRSSTWPSVSVSIWFGFLYRNIDLAKVEKTLKSRITAHPSITL